VNERFTPASWARDITVVGFLAARHRRTKSSTSTRRQVQGELSASDRRGRLVCGTRTDDGLIGSGPNEAAHGWTGHRPWRDSFTTPVPDITCRVAILPPRSVAARANGTPDGPRRVTVVVGGGSARRHGDRRRWCHHRRGVHDRPATRAGTASPRRQVAVIAMVARDVVRPPRRPPDGPSGMRERSAKQLSQGDAARPNGMS
jgi:hypothetical protein